MKGLTRVVLVDPDEASRAALEAQLAATGTLLVAEACASYAAGTRAVAEHAAPLLVVDLDPDPDAALALIRSAARSNPPVGVLPASRRRDGDLILRAVRAGAREFLTLPASPEDLVGAVDRLLGGGGGDDDAGRGSKIIAVAGAAGGVGCTTLAVNLGTHLAKAPDHQVVLADFDLLLGSVDACLDLIPDRTLLDVAQNVDRLDLTLLKRSLTRHASGLYILPRPAALEDVARVDPEALRRVLGLLQAAFSTILIDTSKGLQAADMLALEVADVILLVVQLDLPCLRNTMRLLQLFRQFEGVVDRVRIVVNRSGSKHYDIGPKKAEASLNLPISYEIPNDTVDFSAARSRGVPLEGQAPGSRAVRAFAEIARDLVPAAEAAGPSKPRRLGRFAALF